MNLFSDTYNNDCHVCSLHAHMLVIYRYCVRYVVIEKHEIETIDS